MQAWIVAEGQTTPYDPERLPPRDRYGWDWIYVEAPDRPTALAEAQRYDSTRTTEETLFAVGYRNGALSLPGDRLVSTTEVARQAHTTPGTVRNWRQRHPTFPEPAADLRTGPIWWWSDVAAWLAIPRPAGRPRRLTRNP